MNLNYQWTLALLGFLLFLPGCQSPTMKGTPFYTGEYEGPQEGYTDRVNLWPALYYRDPAQPFPCKRPSLRTHGRWRDFARSSPTNEETGVDAM
jgi:hypothetical protein